MKHLLWIVALLFAQTTFAATTYTFESDTLGATPATTTITTGTVVATTTSFGKSMIATVKSGEIAGLMMDEFSSSTDYSIVWKQGYTENTGNSGFILRAQNSATTFAGHTGARLGYLFQVYGSNSVYIWKVTNAGFTSLYSGTLAKANPRYFKATVVGSSQGFDYSSDGVTWTHISTTTDATYNSGLTQYTAGYGTSVGVDYVDDVSYTNLALIFTGSNSYVGTQSVAMPINDLQINATSSTTVTPVKLRVTSGTLAMTTTTGLTFDGSESGATLYFSGTVANINNALSTLTYTRGSTGSDTLEASLVTQGEVFFSDNGHLYKYISSTLTWTNAQTAAAALTAYNSTGYLTTITSQAENDFVAARLSDAGWMGASDSATESTWKWVTGPENGTTFWQGAVAGATVGGNYANWGTGEPNDHSSGEDCAQFLSGSSGKWNDLPCTGTTLPGYVVEFGTQTSLPAVVAKNVSISTTNAPTVSSFSPVDNATNVAVDSNLIVTFSQSVSTSTGNAHLRKTSDNSLVETFATVTGGGTTAITLNPTSNLAEGTEYYVYIDATAFKNGSNVNYAGTAASTTWSFTTGDFTAPSISSLAGSSTASTTAQVTWSTNEVASTKVVYGPTSAFGSSTAETDTGTRVIPHAVSLSSLAPCATYYFAAVSRDAAANAATSSASSFTTSGCVGSTTQISATTTAITVSSGGSTSLTEEDATITITAPSNFTSTSSSVVIQIHSLSSTEVLDSIGTPSNLLGVGGAVFDVKAIINSSTILDSFDSPVTIEYEYADADIEGIQESTLSLYHYHDDIWSELDDCSVDVGANTITCTAPNFSIFSLFGQAIPGAVVSSSKSVTSIKERVFNLQKTGNTVAAENLKKEWPKLFPTVATTTSVRDLTLKDEGEDVVNLQEYLISKNTGPAALELKRVGATGYFGRYTQAALSEFQKTHDIYPSAGYYGPITRAKIKMVQ